MKNEGESKKKTTKSACASEARTAQQGAHPIWNNINISQHFASVTSLASVHKSALAALLCLFAVYDKQH